MTFTPLKHIVFVPGPPWGHLRPGLKTSLRMVEKFPNIFISIFVYKPEVSKATKYLSAQTSAYSKRVRIVTATNSEGDPLLSPGTELAMFTSFEKSFGLWITNELEQPTIVQLDGHPVNPPSIIMEDIFTGGVALACKDVHELPILGWWLMPAASLLSITGSGQDAGIFDTMLESSPQDGDKLVQDDGEGKDAFDRLVSIPGMPAFYEWELATQELPFIGPLMGYLVARWKHFVKHIDTVICGTTFGFEPVSCVALSDVFKTSPFLIGPAVDLVTPHKPDPESPVTQFLDRAYTEKGAHSVVYVAFGTHWFPPASSMHLLMAALDEIPKAGLKFVFALSSESAQVDQSWKDAHVQAGNAIFPEWTNQTAVLEHPAIHYFLSHGGWNSSIEAIVRGVPMIFWPIAGDQPMNSVQIAAGHDCGFELLQVRTGPAKSTAYRNGTVVEIKGTEDSVRDEMKDLLRLSKGSRGGHQRTNVRLLGRIVAESLAPGGSGDVGLEEFGKALGLV